MRIYLNVLIFLGTVDLKYLPVGPRDLLKQLLKINSCADYRDFEINLLGLASFLIFKKKCFFLHHKRVEGLKLIFLMALKII
jgi:hypothetical protein